MRIRGIYAALVVDDMSAAEQLYTMLFGRGPDDRPMDGLIQWRNVAGANIQVFRGSAPAGHSRCTIVVPQMDDARRDLHDAGHQLEDEREGTFGRIAQLRDPAGNLITLAAPPRGDSV